MKYRLTFPPGLAIYEFMKTRSVSILLFVISSVTFGCTSFSKAANLQTFVPCERDPHRQRERSRELQRIVGEDQKDRIPPIDWNEVSPRDEERAKRVAEIFAEGCFHAGEDYAAAALVFQHGTVPDHFYQAYIWSKKAVELGRREQMMMVGNTVDRYLISSGHKQLFAAQTFRQGPNMCVCLKDTEQSFPDDLRVQYMGLTLAQKIEKVKSRNRETPGCLESPVYCPEKLADPPKGMFPGIW